MDAPEKGGTLRIYTRCQRKAQQLRNERLALQLSNSLEPCVEGDLRVKISSETCFHLMLKPGVSTESFWERHNGKLSWLLSHHVFSPEGSDVTTQSRLRKTPSSCIMVEIGPKPLMTTPFSTNSTSILHAMGIDEIVRLEQSTVYAVEMLDNDKDGGTTREDCGRIRTLLFGSDSILRDDIFNMFGDRMTQCQYPEGDVSPLDKSRSASKVREPYYVIDISAEGALERINEEHGLGFDSNDIAFYQQLFAKKLKRNPTNVELFDLAQSNSEHSRHWFFKGDLTVDGVQREESLLASVQNTQFHSNRNNMIAFTDNSSAIYGFNVENLKGGAINGGSSQKLITAKSPRHIVYTAETHNFPTAVCPFPGSATGVGGRIRDVHATGRGAHEIAGIAGYSVGLLLQPLRNNWAYPGGFACPLKILLEASDGASDYGNKFGEPLIGGFTRSYGALLGERGERIEYVKPIMFSGGIGSIDEDQLYKVECQPGQLVAKIGGPVYRIGVGGGSASSLQVQGKRSDASADYGAVQRGDPEMEQKLHRLIRGCAELGEKNPILSIHDQGAGGNGNVLKEIVEGKNGGATFSADAFELGDPSVSLLELWGAEYQENDAILADPKRLPQLERIAKRERCPVSIVGQVDGSCCVTLGDFTSDTDRLDAQQQRLPVDLDLRLIGERANKSFALGSASTHGPYCPPLKVADDAKFLELLEGVLRLQTVASKRFLTSKVDRSVTGLIAQQQCVGPLHTPIADVACVALSYWDSVGAAVGVGEQPIKGLLEPERGARMSVGEALTNLLAAPITSLGDVKCSANWMWAAKLSGEGARLVKACDAMCELMQKLGIAVDGGKDSLSMAAHLALTDEVVKSPGTLVISAYAPCIDVCSVVTPDFKTPSEDATVLLFLPMAAKRKTWECMRFGGSALAQCLGVYGGDAPDLDDAHYFVRCFDLVQKWIKCRLLLAVHDVSDGGLITTVLESAFAGACSVQCEFPARDGSVTLSDGEPSEDSLKWLFAEELGVVMEVSRQAFTQLTADAAECKVYVEKIGVVRPCTSPSDANIVVKVGGWTCLDAKLSHLRDVWEEISDRLEGMQISAKCLEEQREWRRHTATPILYSANFDWSRPALPTTSIRIERVAILREEGSNGDREIAAAFMVRICRILTHDLTMTDVLECALNYSTGDSLRSLLGQFSGIAFVGGFSYADVLGSAKGWAATIRFNKRVRDAFESFRLHEGKFTLGVCNGCQLMALLGFIGDDHNSSEEPSIFLDDNESGRFYSGFNTVRVDKSSAVLLKNMEGAVLGVWCSHGEGKFTYRSSSVLASLENNEQIALRYGTNDGAPSMRYPENPNGSENSVAGICSVDGRHLALMPHPDRSFLKWQWPSYPATGDLAFKTQDYTAAGEISAAQFTPWMRLFQNAYEFSLASSRDDTA